MDEDKLLAFLTIAKEKSFTQTANLLYVSQPSISKRIRTLEKELGCELLVRSKQKVELSQDGKKFYPYAEKVYNLLSRARMELEGNVLLSNIDYPLRIASTTALSFYVLPAILNEFKIRFPDKRIDLYTKRSSEITEMITNEEIDIGIVQSLKRAENLPFIPLFQSQYTMMISKNRFLKDSPFSLKDLTNQPVIQYSKGDFWDPIENLFKKHNIYLNCTIQSDSAESIKRLVKSGIGLSFLPSFIIEQEASSEMYVTTQIEHITLPHRTVSLVFLKKNKKLVESFIKGMTRSKILSTKFNA